MKVHLLPVLLFSTLALALTPSQIELPELISNEVNELSRHDKISQKLLNAVTTLTKLNNKEIFCQACDLVVNQVVNYRRSGASKDSMMTFLQKICTSFTDISPVACQGYVAIEIDTILYIIDNKANFYSAKACSIYFQAKGCEYKEPESWSIDLPLPIPSVRSVPPGPPLMKILHLTDFHYDPLYKNGSNADCGLPLCCQEGNGTAGYWGDYHVCDTPWHALVELMTQVNSSQYDIVYYTGDIISHKSWATSKEGNEAAIKKVLQLLAESFPLTHVYPILGNHEPHPTDFYSPPGINGTVLSTSWIFDLAAEEWKRWLPNDTFATIKRGGFYTVKTSQGFRIIALNSNVCYTPNLWLLYSDQDPYGQLAWLVEQLTEAEKAGEKVHILSHVPPGHTECLQQWSNQYRKIVERFSSIINAQFNGHTHLDELRLFRSPNNSKEVINVAFNAGSFTSFVGLNPNYRVYDVTTGTFEVEDYSHYYYNLTEANLKSTSVPNWKKLYSFKDAYGLMDTSSKSLADLADRIAANRTLTNQYYRFQVRESEPKIAEGCDETCLKLLACSVTAVEAVEAIKCENLT